MMNPTLYLSAIHGRTTELIGLRDQFNDQRTPNGNSVLHLAALYGHIESLNEILKFSPSLLHCDNIHGESPLHFAVKGGDVDTIEALVHVLGTSGQVAKEFLKATNSSGDNALHMAVKHRHVDVVRFLLGYAGDDRILYSPNKDEESPLYIAAAMRLEQAVVHILDACCSPYHSGPLGRTALHASVISNSIGITQKLLQWNAKLSMKVDENGWTPLHFAAKWGSVEMVRQLLEFGTSSAYLTSNDQDHKQTALHIAAARGDREVFREILAMCPDSGEIVNGCGQNVLHLAVIHKKKNVVRYILKTLYLSSLINQKDGNGNTPAHILAFSNGYSKDLIRRSEKIVFNKERRTPWDVARSIEYTEIREQWFKNSTGANAHIGLRETFEEFIRKQARDLSEEDMRNHWNTNLIVGTLVATATFATTLQVPGGYNSKGLPVLEKNTYFQIFMTLDFLAFLLSVFAIISHIIVLLNYMFSKENRIFIHTISTILIYGALVTMILAIIPAFTLQSTSHSYETSLFGVTLALYLFTFVLILIIFTNVKTLFMTKFYRWTKK